MNGQCRLFRESRIALIVFVGSLSSVSANVLGETGPLREGGVAEIAFVGSLSSVNANVSDQMGLTGESRIAVIACEGLLSTVSANMMNQCRLVTIGRVTVIALEGLLSSVSANVNRKSAQTRCQIVAVRAFMSRVATRRALYKRSLGLHRHCCIERCLVQQREKLRLRR